MHPPCPSCYAPPTHHTSIDDAMEKGLGWRGGTRSSRYSRGKWPEAEGKSARTCREGRGAVEGVLLGWVWLHLCDGPPGSVAVRKQLLLPSGGDGQREGEESEVRGGRVLLCTNGSVALPSH